MGCDNFAWRILDNLVKMLVGPALDRRIDSGREDEHRESEESQDHLGAAR